MSSVSMNTAVVPEERPASGLRAWPLRTRPLVIVAVGIAGMIGIWAAVGLFVDHVIENTPLVDADQRIPQWFEDHRTSTWNSLTYWGSMLADTYVKIGLIVVVGVAAMIAWRRWHDALLLAGSVIIEATVFLFASLIVQRPRPEVEQLDPIPPTGSFPSGHSAAATAFYVALCTIIFWHTRRTWLRGLFVAIAVLAPVIVGLSRIQRGMHHPIDVIAGMILGVCSVLVMRRALRAGTERLAELDERDEIQAPPQTLHLDLTEPEEVAR
jgi:undecaprenyl-diphosphatase